jgi:hypothetical protein
MLANASPRLPGLHADGVQYLEEARSLARADAPRVPVGDWSSSEPYSGMVFHPPGFPMVIALPIAAGLRPDAAAVLVIALAAGATVLLAFALVRGLAGVPAGALAVVLLLAMPSWVRLHTAVWSEPLYLALLLTAVLALVRHPERSGTHGVLALGCTLVRHVGISVAATAGLIAMLAPGDWRSRVKRASAATLPSVLFLVGWHLFGARDGAPLREARLHEGSQGSALAVADVLRRWLVPVGEGGVAWLIAAFAAVALVVACVRSPVWGRPQWRRYAVVAACIAFLHLVVVVVSRLFVDPEIPLDDRLLMPALVLATIGVAAGLAAGWGRDSALTLRDGIVMAALAAWLIAGGLQIRNGLAGIRGYGQYYTAAVWDQSPVLAWAKELGEAGGPLPYSNEPEMIWLHTGRPAYRTPRLGDSLAEFSRAFAARPGPIILVRPLRPTDIAPSALPSDLNLRTLLSAPEGVVLVPASESPR